MARLLRKPTGKEAAVITALLVLLGALFGFEINAAPSGSRGVNYDAVETSRTITSTETKKDHLEFPELPGTWSESFSLRSTVSVDPSLP